jgi:dUTP pyrophosphatase
MDRNLSWLPARVGKEDPLQAYGTFLPAVRFKKLIPDAIIPVRATAGAACFDLYSNSRSVLHSGVSRRIISTGIGIELPPGYVGLVCSRSGLAAKDGLFVLNSPGIIDADYRGEIKVILSYLPGNLDWPTPTEININVGDRIAQLMILALPQLRVEIVTDLSTTERGTGGLGSTGV